MTRAAIDAMICMDAPAHLQVRPRAQSYFTPAYLKGVKDKVAAETTRLLDAIGAAGRSATSSSSCRRNCPCSPLRNPRRAAVGSPAIPALDALSREIEQHPQPAGRRRARSPGLRAFLRDFNDATSEMFEYGVRMLHKRRTDPQPDLMSAIAAAQLDGQVLSDGFLTGSWLLIVFAGNDTTRNTISGAMHLLSRFPGEKEKLIADPSFLPNAVNEFHPHDQSDHVHAAHGDAGRRDRRTAHRRRARR